MSPPFMMMKTLFLQNMMDFAWILLPVECTMRSEPCSEKHLLEIVKSILSGIGDLNLLKGYMGTYYYD